MDDFAPATQARIRGLQGEPALNGRHCVCLGPASGGERVQVRLGCGRELALRPSSLHLAGAGGTLAPGSRVVLAGLSAAAWNGREGSVTGPAEGAGRLLVDLGGEAKALRAECLVLLPGPEAPEDRGSGDATSGPASAQSERELLAQREIAAAARGFPIGCLARIEGLVEARGRENSGDLALNGKEGTVVKADPDEPGRLILKLKIVNPAAKLQEAKLKSISYRNLVRLDGDKEGGQKRAALESPGASTTALSLGAGGKRCKITEVAIASGDKVAAFAAAARSRDGTGGAEAGSLGSVGDEVARSNALIYARTDAVSEDDAVARAALERLAELCLNFAMKAVCALGVDVVENGTGKVGSSSAETIEQLAEWLSGGDSDGILRRKCEAGKPCAGQKDALAACRKCALRGLKGDRLLALIRRNASGLKDFVTRACKER